MLATNKIACVIDGYLKMGRSCAILDGAHSSALTRPTAGWLARRRGSSCRSQGRASASRFDYAQAGCGYINLNGRRFAWEFGLSNSVDNQSIIISRGRPA
jgi:hypothetical protein